MAHDSGPDSTDAVVTFLCDDRADLLNAIRTCAEASARAGTEGGRSDTQAVRHGTERCLREAGVWGTLPRLLADCVERTGERLVSTPVAAPPYVAPTATGVVLRATLSGGRLVVAVDALAVDRAGEGVRLRPREESLDHLVRVEWRE